MNTLTPPIINPTASELESRHLARLLEYAMRATDQEVPDWLEWMARAERGDIDQLPIVIDLLVDLCAGLSSDQSRFILGNGRNECARDLSAWWKGYLSAASNQAVS